MIHKKMQIVFFTAWLLVMICNLLQAETKARTTGIGIRGSYWHMDNHPTGVTVKSGIGYTEVDVGSGGGWLYFFSRVNDNLFLEFSLGAVGKVENEENYVWGSETDVNAVTPVLLGVRSELFSYKSSSALKPYLSFGAGPYWINDVFVREEWFEEEVTVTSRVKPGAYAGGGMNFMFTSWFGFNFDVKYHFVDFNVNQEYSGFDYGFGLMFTWGHYDPN